MRLASKTIVHSPYDPMKQKYNATANSLPCDSNSTILQHLTDLAPPSLVVAPVVVHMVLPIQPLMRFGDRA